MINIVIDSEKHNLPESLGLTDDRAREIFEEIKRLKRIQNKISDTLKWACFTEQLNGMSERVFALYVIGGEGYKNAERIDRHIERGDCDGNCGNCDTNC